MKVTLVASAVGAGDAAPDQHLTTYLINDVLALDAGALGLYGTPDEQARVRHVLISHTHIDHLASLPVFLDNAYTARPDPVTVHGSPEVLESLCRDIFNGRLWPDYPGLPSAAAPFVRLSPLEAGRATELEGLHVTPVPVDHAVPTLGFIVEDGSVAVLFPSDTGPTEAIWQHANRTPNLKAVFLEASFPDDRTDLAAASKHLTPALFGREIAKLHRSVSLIAVHLKPRFRAQIVRELEALGLPDLRIGRPGAVYEF